MNQYFYKYFYLLESELLLNPSTLLLTVQNNVSTMLQLLDASFVTLTRSGRYETRSVILNVRLYN